MVMLWISMLGSAQAEFPGWTQYAQCVAATAVAMPATYAMGEALTGTSNQLVPGMLPAVISGIVLPASISVGSASLIANKSDMEMDTGSAFGQTVGLNAGVYAAGTALGVSTDKWQDRLIYGAVSALLLPLPSMLAMKSPNSTASVLIAPSGSDGWLMNASFQHRF